MLRYAIICVALLATSVSSLVHERVLIPCPDGFVKIHDRCYYFSIVQDTFDQSEFNCREKKSHLAVISGKKQDYLLKEYLKRQYVAKAPRWLGGQYNWKKKQWNWRLTGRPIKYQPFSSKLQTFADWDCLLTDPASDYKWTAERCFEKNYYICQTHPSAKYHSTGHGKHSTVYNDTNSRGIMNTQPGYYVVTQRPSVNRLRCPKDFQLVKKKCYLFSEDAQTWQDAFYKCEEKKSQLAIFKNPSQQMKLRLHASKKNIRESFWTGGVYDWKNNVWKWAKTGQKVKGQIQQIAGDWLCMIWDFRNPSRLSSESCVRKKRYLCQTSVIGNTKKRIKSTKTKFELEIKLYNSTTVPPVVSVDGRNL